MLPPRRYQYQACSRRVTSCLNNQPYHLVTEDAEREAAGLGPIYRAQRYAQAGSVGIKFNLTGPLEERTMKIQYPVPAISSSLLTLEVAADSLKFIQNYSPGKVCISAMTGGTYEGILLAVQYKAAQNSQSTFACSAELLASCQPTFLFTSASGDCSGVLQILSAQVCNSARTVCDSVAALNSASMAMIEVKNTGTLTASYITTLDNCTYPTIPVAAQSLSLAAKETASIWFEVLLQHILFRLCPTGGHSRNRVILQAVNER